MSELLLISTIVAIFLLIIKELLIKFIDADRDLLGYVVFAMILGIFGSGLIAYAEHGLLY
tara:strand:- start:955 stop:1134 length:180 start_codon:yes stop_codon:yes gene_type:complete